MKKPRSYEQLLMQIANNIRLCRKRKGLTQEDMANLGFNYRFYQKIESGLYSPNLKTLYRISQALGVSISELID